MPELQIREEEYLLMSSLSSSDHESMTYSNSSNSSDISCFSMTSSSSSNYEISPESIPDEYKEKILSFILMTNISIDILDNHCHELFEFTAIRQLDMDLC